MVNDPPKTPTPLETTRTTKSVSDLCQDWTSRLRNRKEDGRAITASDIKKLESRLAATKITDEPANAAKGAPAKGSQEPESIPISFSINGVNILEDEVDHFQDSIDFVKEALNLMKLVDLEDLDEARKSLDELSSTNEALSKYRTQHTNLEHLQAISFSRLTPKHMADMGVKTECLTYRNFRNKIDEWFNTKTFIFGPEKERQPLSELFKSFWKELTSNEKFFRVYKTLRKSVAHKPEARARVLTDYIVEQVVDFLENYLDVIHLVFLELLLASAKKDPVVITHEKSATLLTGTVDYAIWSSALTSKAMLKNLGGGSLSDVEKRIRALTDKSSLMDIMMTPIWRSINDFNCFKFSIIEEKRRDLNKKTLKDCAPQVIGEGLSILEQTSQDCVSWCLSNGEEWLFGLLKRENQGFVSFSLPLLTIREDKLEEDIQMVFKMLVLWTVISEDGIKTLIG